MRDFVLFFVFSYMSLFGVPAGSGSPRPLEAALSDTLQIISSDTSRTATDSIYPDTVTLRYYSRDTVWRCTIGIFNFIRYIHPNMFAHTSESVMEQNVNALKYIFPDSLTSYQAYSYIAPVVALVGDGHTYINSPRDMYYAHNPYWLPATPYIDKKDLKLKLSHAPFDYDEIISINGKRNRDMVDKLLSYSGIETLSGRVYHINTMMPFFFAFVDSSSVFHVDYIGKDGERHTAALEGVRIKEHQRRIGVRDDKSDVTFSRVDPSTVLFTLPSFDEEKAPRVIDSMFSYINSEPKVKNLIIDLRNNGGGSMKVMFQLLKYLPANILPCYSDEISSDDLDSGRVLKPQLLANPLPKRKRFNGDLYVLIDNGSYSASIIFSYYVRHDRLGLLIGEPTGSSVFTNVIANDSLDFPCGLSLKFSIATLWLPDLEYYRDTMEPIYPDIEVSSGDALDKAFEIISSGGIKSFRKGK